MEPVDLEGAGRLDADHGVGNQGNLPKLEVAHTVKGDLAGGLQDRILQQDVLSGGNHQIGNDGPQAGLRTDFQGSSAEGKKTGIRGLPGFDFENIPDPTSPENIEKPNGRGVFLMRQLADECTFEELGRVAILTFENAIPAPQNAG